MVIVNTPASYQTNHPKVHPFLQITEQIGATATSLDFALIISRHQGTGTSVNPVIILAFHVYSRVFSSPYSYVIIEGEK
jgi:hypothetical protein